MFSILCRNSTCIGDEMLYKCLLDQRLCELVQNIHTFCMAVMEIGALLFIFSNILNMH